MHFIKIICHHVFFEGFNKTTLWAWIRILALTADIESRPSEDQILAIITKKEYQKLLEHFSKCNKSLSNVISKVLEDVGKVQEERERKKQERLEARNYKKSIRQPKNNKSSTDATSDSLRNGDVTASIDKIREDKIREDKHNTVGSSSSDKLLSTWKDKNPEDAKNPNMITHARKHIKGALARGWNAEDVEKKLWDTADHAIAPWDLFKEKEEDEQCRRKRLLARLKD